MKINDFKLSNQIKLTQLCIFIFVAAMGLFSYFTLNRLMINSETFNSHPVVTQKALSSIKEDILSIRLLMQEDVLDDISVPIQDKPAAMDSYETDALKQLDVLAVSYLGPESDLETLKNNILDYHTIRTETLRLQSVGSLAEAKQEVRSDGVGGVQAKEIINSIGVMEDFAYKKSNELYLDSQQQVNHAIQVIVIVFVSTIIMTSGALILLKKNILVPLEELENVIDNYEQGKLGARSSNESKNEIGMIAKSFNLMTERIERESQEKISKAAELLIAKTEISTQAALIIMQKAYYLDKQLFQATLLSIGDAVISCDIHSKIIFLNKAAEALTGWRQEEALGQPVENVFSIFHEKTHEKCANIIDEVIRARKIIELGIHTILISKDGSEKSVEDSAAPIFKENGELSGAVLVFRDVTEKRDAIKEIEYLGYHDKLTGLYNRRFYEEEIQRLDTARNLPLTIIMGDANGLKLINDTFGHTIGDELLKKAAKSIKRGCRSDDIVARLGGDEFVAILAKADKAETEIIINRIKAYVCKDEIKNIPISVSFGHGTKTDENQDIQEIFKNAEDDMYKQKLYESSSMRSRTVTLIMNTLYEKNVREMLHSKRVGEFCEALAIKMNFDSEDINRIRLAGLMHDIGKIGIEEGILNKQDKLTPMEFEEIKRHSEIGYRILISVYEFSEIAAFILEHHERWDGKGYPKGLKGNEISLQGRMICLADSFDAMTRERTYKEKLTVKEAIHEIRKYAGTQFDPDITEKFIEVVMEIDNNSMKAARQ